MKITVDLHDVYNRGWEIDRALREAIDEAERTHAAMVEIIPGKGSGQLKKRVLRFLDQPEVRSRYHRVEKDSRNFGRLFIHFRWVRGLPRSAPPARRATGAETGPLAAGPPDAQAPSSPSHSRGRTPRSGR